MTHTPCRTALAGLAVATLACAVHAQTSSVQITGQVGAGLTHKSNQGAGRTSLEELTDNLLSASYLRFQGTEDLGGGLRAHFRLESGLAMDTGGAGGNGAGGAKFWNRQSWVGVQMGRAGTVTLGRQFHAATDRGIRTFDVYNFAPSSLHAVPLALFGVNRYAGNDTRADNAIKYRFGAPGGPEFGVSVAAGEGATGRSASADAAYGGANYAVGISYVSFDGNAVVAGSLPEHKLLGVGGNVTFGAVKVYLSYFDSSLDATVAPTASAGRTQENQIVDLGVAWQVQPLLTLKAAYYDDKGTRLNGVIGRDGKKRTLVTSAEYNLSVRTALYASLFQNRLSGGYMLEAVNLAGLNRANTTSTVSGFSAGVRHGF